MSSLLCGFSLVLNAWVYHRFRAGCRVAMHLSLVPSWLVVCKEMLSQLLLTLPHPGSLPDLHHLCTSISSSSSHSEGHVRTRLIWRVLSLALFEVRVMAICLPRKVEIYHMVRDLISDLKPLLAFSV